jgi:hypothetical protein
MQRKAFLPYRVTRGSNESLHLLYSISTLREEQAVLQEEVLQLRATVQIYMKILETLAAQGDGIPKGLLLLSPRDARN